MDIAITLTMSLWKKIVTGEKTIELRKNFPIDFNFNEDKVFVCLKGTEFIVGYFMVSSFVFCTSDHVCTSQELSHKIAVPIKWIYNYVTKKSWVYLWYIGGVFVFKGNGIHRSLFRIYKNPQSFIYLR